MTAYKTDVTIDESRLQFDTSDRSLEIGEQARGWEEFLEALPTHLAGCWNASALRSAAVKPTFVRDETVIYEGKHGLRSGPS